MVHDIAIVTMANHFLVCVLHHGIRWWCKLLHDHHHLCIII